MVQPLDFEKDVHDIELKLSELQHLSNRGDFNITDEMSRLQNKLEKHLVHAYSRLTPWQKVQVARHPDRPHTHEYIRTLIQDFVPLAGDRTFGEDAAIIGGLGRFQGQSVVCLGHEKGNDTESRVKHNFGMARPEGYRKAVRLMDLANQHQLPLLTFIDTAGAHPGLDAEERGQSEAIAKSIQKMLTLTVPIICVVTGEGGSGGAIAIGVGNRVYMLKYSIYSVISPEGCASILWRTGEKKDLAAHALRMTADDLLQLKIIDGIIDEPLGAAHRNRLATIENVGKTIESALQSCTGASPETLRQNRREKFLKMGQAEL